MTVKQLQEFFLENRIRCKFTVSKERVIFRLSRKDWNEARKARHLSWLYGTGVMPILSPAELAWVKFWICLQPFGVRFTVTPFLMPWECREQIAVYCYIK